MGSSGKGIHMEPLHKRQDLVEPCVELLNAQWPRSKAARLHSLDKSCDGLPYSLVMVDDKHAVIGYCRLARVISVPCSVLIESVVVPEWLRGRGLGRKLMQLAESYAKAQGYTVVYLSTKDKQDLYAHLGYEFCSAVNTLDAQMLETCNCLQAECKSSPTFRTSLSTPYCSSGERHDSQSQCQSFYSTNCSSNVHVVQSSINTRTDSAQGHNAQCQTIRNAPVPPPPPPVRVSTIPGTVIYWMKKDIS